MIEGQARKLWSILYGRLSSSKREVIVPSLFRNLVRSSAEEALNLVGLPYSSMLYTRLHGVIINSALLDGHLTCVTTRPHATNCMGILYFDIRRKEILLGLLRNYDIFATITFALKKRISFTKFPSRVNRE